MKKLIYIFTFIFFISIVPLSIVHADSGTITLTKVNTSPETIEPGNKFKINFSIKNNKDSKLKDVIITLVGLEGKNTLTGFSPVGTTNEIYVGDISNYSTNSNSINMICDPSLKAGSYNLTVKISYKLYGQYNEETRVIGIVLSNNPNLIITSINPKDSDNGKKLNVNFINSGRGTLKDVMVNVTAKDKHFSKFFGTMESEDENEFSQELNLSGNIDGKIEISYKDELNKDGKITQDFNIKGEKIDTNSNNKNKKGVLSHIGSFFKALLGIGD